MQVRIIYQIIHSRSMYCSFQTFAEQELPPSFVRKYIFIMLCTKYKRLFVLISNRLA